MSGTPDSKEAGSAIVQAAKEGTLEAYLKGAKREATEGQWDALVGEVLEHHLAGRIDLTTAFVGEAETRLNHASQLLLGKVLPRVSDKLTDVVRLLESVSARGGGELPYYFIDPFGRWIEEQASRPMETLEAIQSASAPQGLLRVVLSTGLKVDRARFLTATTELAAGTDAAEREAACDVLGRFAEFDAEEQTVAVTALEGALRFSTGKNVVAPLRALLLISLRGAGHAPIGLRAFEEVAPRSDAHVREAIAGEIMFKTQDASNELAAAAFALLKDTTKTEGATLDFIDQIASQNLNGRLTSRTAACMPGNTGSGFGSASPRTAKLSAAEDRSAPCAAAPFAAEKTMSAAILAERESLACMVDPFSCCSGCHVSRCYALLPRPR